MASNPWLRTLGFCECNLNLGLRCFWATADQKWQRNPIWMSKHLDGILLWEGLKHLQHSAWYTGQKITAFRLRLHREFPGFQLMPPAILALPRSNPSLELGFFANGICRKGPATNKATFSILWEDGGKFLIEYHGASSQHLVWPWFTSGPQLSTLGTRAISSISDLTKCGGLCTIAGDDSLTLPGSNTSIQS